jgi:hypothetical protein
MRRLRRPKRSTGGQCGPSAGFEKITSFHWHSLGSPLIPQIEFDAWFLFLQALISLSIKRLS